MGWSPLILTRVSCKFDRLALPLLQDTAHMHAMLHCIHLCTSQRAMLEHAAVQNEQCHIAWQASGSNITSS